MKQETRAIICTVLILIFLIGVLVKMDRDNLKAEHAKIVKALVDKLDSCDNCYKKNLDQLEELNQAYYFVKK